MPDHGHRPDLPGVQQPGQRPFDGEEGGLRHGGVAQSFRRVRRAAQEHLAQRGRRRCPEQVQALVERVPEHPFPGVEFAGHLRVLRPLSGEHEHRPAGRLRGAAHGGVGQCLGQRVGVPSHHGEAMPVAQRPALQGTGHGCRGGPLLRQVLRQLPGHRLQRVGRGRRERQHHRGPVRRRPGGRTVRRLFHQDVDVRTTDAERADARDAGAGSVPRSGLGADVEGGRLQLHQRVRGGEVRGAGNDAALDGQHGLDEARDAGGRSEVPDVALDRGEQAVAGPVGEGTEGAGQCLRLDGIAQRGPGAVRLDVSHLRRVHAGHGEGLVHRGELSFGARSREARLAVAVVVHGGTPDHRHDPVVVAQRVLQRFEHHRAGPVTEDRPVGRRVEGAAQTVPGEDPALYPPVTAAVREFQLDAARHGHVALPVAQRLAGEVYGEERGGARGGDGERGSAQVEFVGGDGGDVVVVVSRLDAHFAVTSDRGGVPAHVQLGVAVGRAAGEDSDGARACRIDRRVLQGAVHHLQEHALLRVSQFGLPGAESEQTGVEAGDVVQEGCPPDAMRVGDLRLGQSRGPEHVVGQFRDTDGAVEEIGPVRLGVGGPGETTGQPDHCYAVILCRATHQIPPERGAVFDGTGCGPVAGRGCSRERSSSSCRAITASRPPTASPRRK